MYLGEDSYYDLSVTMLFGFCLFSVRYIYEFIFNRNIIKLFNKFIGFDNNIIIIICRSSVKKKNL